MLFKKNILLQKKILKPSKNCTNLQSSSNRHIRPVVINQLPLSTIVRLLVRPKRRLVHHLAALGTLPRGIIDHDGHPRPTTSILRRRVIRPVVRLQQRQPRVELVAQVAVENLLRGGGIIRDRDGFLGGCRQVAICHYGVFVRNWFASCVDVQRLIFAVGYWVVLAEDGVQIWGGGGFRVWGSGGVRYSGDLAKLGFERVFIVFGSWGLWNCLVAVEDCAPVMLG
uniref:(northern house mosquito) hypothetical protein n=1 Tax=Culex pipiens TaxID=7175 RepID=A0A8D8BKD2_CULPI